MGFVEILRIVSASSELATSSHVVASKLRRFSQLTIGSFRAGSR